jgi:hypothetical protein
MKQVYVLMDYQGWISSVLVFSSQKKMVSRIFSEYGADVNIRWNDDKISGRVMVAVPDYDNVLASFRVMEVM